ncbi:MAG: hypothetical protein ABIH76_02585, partial [Candidatus Bathyarchaeota archaeon]
MAGATAAALSSPSTLADAVSNISATSVLNPIDSVIKKGLNGLGAAQTLEHFLIPEVTEEGMPITSAITSIPFVDILGDILPEEIKNKAAVINDQLQAVALEEAMQRAKKISQPTQEQLDGIVRDVRNLFEKVMWQGVVEGIKQAGYSEELIKKCIENIDKFATGETHGLSLEHKGKDGSLGLPESDKVSVPKDATIGIDEANNPDTSGVLSQSAQETAQNNEVAQPAVTRRTAKDRVEELIQEYIYLISTLTIPINDDSAEQTDAAKQRLARTKEIIEKLDLDNIENAKQLAAALRKNGGVQKLTDDQKFTLNTIGQELKDDIKFDADHVIFISPDSWLYRVFRLGSAAGTILFGKDTGDYIVVINDNYKGFADILGVVSHEFAHAECIKGQVSVEEFNPEALGLYRMLNEGMVELKSMMLQVKVCKSSQETERRFVDSWRLDPLVSSLGAALGNDEQPSAEWLIETANNTYSAERMLISAMEEVWSNKATRAIDEFLLKGDLTSLRNLFGESWDTAIAITNSSEDEENRELIIKLIEASVIHSQEHKTDLKRALELGLLLMETVVELNKDDLFPSESQGELARLMKEWWSNDDYDEAIAETFSEKECVFEVTTEFFEEVLKRNPALDKVNNDELKQSLTERILKEARRQLYPDANGQLTKADMTGNEGQGDQRSGEKGTTQISEGGQDVPSTPGGQGRGKS